MLGSIHAETALAALGASAGPLGSLLAPAWRWVFYINVPIGIVALAIAWAASTGWETPRRASRIDLRGAVAFTVGLGAAARRADPARQSGGRDALGIPTPALIGGLLVVAVTGVAWRSPTGCVRRDPFLDVRLFRIGVFSSAALVSLLTGYAFATAIVGAAVFVDRVLYGGPDEQQVALGALAAATAVGALASGFAVRRLSLRLVTLAGLLACAVRPRRDGRLVAGDVDRRGRGRAVALFGARLRADRDAALDRGGRGGRPGGLRDGLGDGDRRPDDRHGGRACRS